MLIEVTHNEVEGLGPRSCLPTMFVIDRKIGFYELNKGRGSCVDIESVTFIGGPKRVNILNFFNMIFLYFCIKENSLSFNKFI